MKPSLIESVIAALYSWYRSVIRNPKYRWWIIGGSLLYLLSPLDISPDVFPVIGWIDDGVIATLLITEVSQLLLDGLKSKTRKRSEDQPEVATEAATVDVDSVAV